MEDLQNLLQYFYLNVYRFLKIHLEIFQTTTKTTTRQKRDLISSGFMESLLLSLSVQHL